MKRAIRNEQKEERRQQIIEAAWQLFQERPYEAVNIVDITQRTGIAKGTLFLYFSTKEALFLAVQQQQFIIWFNTIDAQLTTLTPPTSIEQVVSLITQTLNTQPGLTRLFAILHVILERNITQEAANEFKQFLLSRINQTGKLLENCLSFLLEGEGAQTLLYMYALVIGVQHLADPAPVVRQVLDNKPELAVFDVQFAPVFAAASAALLQGLSHKNLGNW